VGWLDIFFMPGSTASLSVIPRNPNSPVRTTAKAAPLMGLALVAQ
jgi:hypothetical protein